MGKNVYGIDLGTTNSAIAVYEYEEVRLIKNMDGFEITPSAVFFPGVDGEGNDEPIVGFQAKNMAAASPEQVVQFVKRMMGCHGNAYNFSAPSGKEYTPEMISALILRKICQDAEQFEGKGAVKDVVITVPAYFDDARRVATKQAGEIAGLNVLRVFNEPTAAAIAFGAEQWTEGKVLVYDLGGGTFDVTVMEVNGGNFDVIATGGDPQLGGVNFDQKLMGLILRQLKEAGCEIDDEDDSLMADIREKAEKTKIQLSNVESARPVFTARGKIYRLEITREAFEAESEELVRRTRFLLENVLKDKGLTWADIDHLLVVGGSTRMPMVRKLLEKLSGKEILYKVDPDTAVAKGAAIFASTLRAADGQPEGEAGENRENRIVVSDVTSQSLGIVALDSADRKKKVNTIIIPHNTKIPVKRSELFKTVCDNQTRIEVQVTEGDDTELEYVNIIGSSILTMPPYPEGAPLEVIYAYDPDQTIYIEVIDKTANQSLGTFEIDRAANLTAAEVKDAVEIVKQATIE